MLGMLKVKNFVQEDTTSFPNDRLIKRKKIVLVC
jgi:hypothetical protein